MKPKIAVIWFPGTNCDEELVRAIAAAGMEPIWTRWNQRDIEKFDGYCIPGGWSYEDRIRAGIIAAKDPIMKVVKEQAASGKPVLGICNGCQVVVEAGLVPGFTSGVELAMAPNVDGYYCVWTHLVSSATKGRSAYTQVLDKGDIIKAPIAHAEGRFYMDEDLAKEMEKNRNILFKFCDETGKITDSVDVNPNGAMENIAGICNKEGNVMALMPHPERAAWFKNIPYHEQHSFKESEKTTLSNAVFESMRKFIKNGN